MKRTFRIENIVWDTDDTFEDNMVELPVDKVVEIDVDEDTDEVTMYEDVVNAASDDEGWCILEYGDIVEL